MALTAMFLFLKRSFGPVLSPPLYIFGEFSPYRYLLSDKDYLLILRAPLKNEDVVHCNPWQPNLFCKRTHYVRQNFNFGLKKVIGTRKKESTFYLFFDKILFPTILVLIMFDVH